jgi:hypothetical protein
MMDGEKNRISISAELINRDLRDRVLSSAAPYLKEYHVNFGEGMIYLTAKLEVKTLGELTAAYRIKVEELKFDSRAHTLLLSYQEDVKSNGGPAQSLMLKAMGLKTGTFLQKALNMAKPAGIVANEKSCSINLDQLFELNHPFISGLSLSYLDSRDDTLWLSYGIH